MSEHQPIAANEPTPHDTAVTSAADSAGHDRYQPHAIETKWQARWEADRLYRAQVDWSRPKHYALTMLPYPSGDLHMGHWFAMTPSDARARYMRLKGYNVLFPMGFDAFGLPAENAAISRGIHPAPWTFANIERMRGQLRSMGAMFDWEREAVSCEPIYYRWTEWFFKKFYECDLAYRGEALVNWSPTLQTVLANEQVIDGKDERTGQPVIQKMMTQWFFRYTRYADEMLNFDRIDWTEPVRIMQTNWIGRSEGARVTFRTEAGEPFEIFTTRPDTLWGATFMVLAPEHPLVANVTTADQRDAVEAYVQAAARQTELERQSDDREKTGVFTGGYAINPVNGERVPIWTADYVLITYGTGAIMAVPAHDERDYAFAQRFGIEIRPVIKPADAPDTYVDEAAYAGSGVMINSGHFNGTVSNGEKGRANPAISAVIDWLVEQGSGKEAINYRLRDWLISRQRYWGAPIPMIFKADGSVAPVSDDQLPVELPTDVQITGVGNPLGSHPAFVNTVDADGQPARRETDTMDTFMCSSWYWYRYLSPKLTDKPFDPEEAAYWLPVDTYTGGAEHATMHLLYARWFTKAMRDLGMFDETAAIMREHGKDPSILMLGEPFMQYRSQGQVLGEERDGDTIIAIGEWENNVKLYAHTVGVLAPTGETRASSTQEAAAVQAVAAKTGAVIIGEIMKRTENVLTVQDAAGRTWTVEVPEAARITIPGIPGPNTVSQLKHHLEIQRMSKSKGNVVNPDDLVRQYGADTVRAYIMFGFDWTKGGPWNSQNIQGVVRWLNEVWDMAHTPPAHETGDADGERQAERRLHQAIKGVEDRLIDFNFNRAVSELMALKNDLRALVRDGKLGRTVWHHVMKDMLILMAPFTPHIAEELWERLGEPYSIHNQRFPEYDAAKAADDVTTLVIMKNGKPVERIMVPAHLTDEEAQSLALASKAAQRILDGAPPKRVILIANRGETGLLVDPKVNIVV
ncbi:MAG: leucine--tRNA ligase [bacterium]|nr:leucine--tRNA ligase [bacterium]